MKNPKYKEELLKGERERERERENNTMQLLKRGR
jgi:hypothetical protein